MEKSVQRIILLESHDFKKFWQTKGPFKYALTSREYPPVLLGEEEWLFSNDLTALLKELMEWDKRKMRILNAPIGKKDAEKFDLGEMSRWRIEDFPGEWTGWESESFNISGYLPLSVTARANAESAGAMEAAFFKSLGETVETIGYLLLKPLTEGETAYLDAYLKEWREDEG